MASIGGSLEDRDAMAESAEASELADDSIDRSDPEDGEEEVDEDGEDEEEDEDPEQESEEEEEEEEEELTGKARFEKRDSDSDTDSLPSVPDGSPLPSDYDSDAEPEPEPEHQGPPPYVIPQPLAGKKLVVVVHELRGLPSGYGDGVFCVVECGDALYEATTLGQGAPPRTVWEQWEEFAMRFDEAGANERTTVTAVATDQGPGGIASPDGREDEPAGGEDEPVRETELAYFAFNALELVDFDDLAARDANAKLASADGDWVPMEPNPRTPDAVLLNASMEARVTLRVEHAGYTSPESASRALEEATHGLHVAAATALSSVAIKRAYAKISAAMETLVAVAVHEARKTRRAERERASAAGKKVPRGKKLDDEEEDADDKEEKAARKRLDPRKVVDGAVAIPGEEEGDSAAGGLTPLARACGRPIGPRAAAIVRALLDLGADPAARSGELSWTPLHHAAACGAVDAVVALCRRSKKAHPRARIVDDVDATDRDGFTPLHVAVVAGHLDVARALLGPGCRASTTQRSGPGGYNALHWAARAGDPRVLAEVRDASGAEATAERTRPPVAPGGGTFGGPSGAQSTNANVGSGSSVVPGQTPIHVAASNGRVRALRLMLRHAPNPRAAMDARDGAGRTPLAAAAAAGKHETVSAMARELGLEADDGDGDGGEKSAPGDDGNGDGNDDGNDDDDAENVVESRGRPPNRVYSFSALEWSAYDARAETVRAVARCGGHTRRDYERAARVAKTRRAKGPVLRLLSRGRE